MCRSKYRLKDTNYSSGKLSRLSCTYILECITQVSVYRFLFNFFFRRDIIYRIVSVQNQFSWVIAWKLFNNIKKK